jgi:hypothetical protein
MTLKIVVNCCYGGFGLSDKAQALLNASDEYGPLDLYDIPRHHPKLVSIVESLGDDASGDFSSLQVHEIPGTLYHIREFDGYELIETPESVAKTWVDGSLL